MTDPAPDPQPQGLLAILCALPGRWALVVGLLLGLALAGGGVGAVDLVRAVIGLPAVEAASTAPPCDGAVEDLKKQVTRIAKAVARLDKAVAVLQDRGERKPAPAESAP